MECQIQIKEEPIEINDEIPTEEIFIKEEVNEDLVAEDSSNESSLLSNYMRDNKIQEHNSESLLEFDHLKNKVLKCPACPKSFNTREKYRDHIRYHNDHRPYKCPDCQKGFRNNTSLKIHMSVHTGAKPFQCHLCHRKYTQNSSLNIHIRTHHIGEKLYQCNLCDFKSENGNDFKQHSRVHAGEKPHKCKICKCRIAPAAEYKKHLLTHQIDVKCKFCEYKTKTSSDLKAHLRVHTGEKPYICSECSKPFRKSSALSVHIRRMHRLITEEGNSLLNY